MMMMMRKMRRRRMMTTTMSRWRGTHIVVVFLFIKHLTPLYTLHLLKENMLVSKG